MSVKLPQSQLTGANETPASQINYALIREIERIDCSCDPKSLEFPDRTSRPNEFYSHGQWLRNRFCANSGVVAMATLLAWFLFYVSRRPHA